MLLAEFLINNRRAILAQTRARVAARSYPKPTQVELANGIPVFLDQLGDALRLAETSDATAHQEITESAGRHGADLLRMGLSIAQVVHDYGDVCQTVTALAIEQHTAIAGHEFRTLNLCLDDAIAGAVTQYAIDRERAIENAGMERLGTLAHELRNLLTTAMLSFDSIKSGRVAPGGSTAIVHSRSLLGIRALVDRTLADVRLDAGIVSTDSIAVTDFVEELAIGALLQAQARGVTFAAAPVDPSLTIEADRHTVAAALANLLHNAFKFTHKAGHIRLDTHATADRVLFAVQDQCGGLRPGTTADLFRAFEQQSDDRSGLGLGLAIALKAAKANGGVIHVRDLPGEGCVFTLDLPVKRAATGGPSERSQHAEEAPDGTDDEDVSGATSVFAGKRERRNHAAAIVPPVATSAR